MKLLLRPLLMKLLLPVTLILSSTDAFLFTARNNNIGKSYSLGTPRRRTMTTSTAAAAAAAEEDTAAAEQAVDHNMTSKYDELAKLIVHEVEQHPHPQYWCAITGGPGAGKSTLAQAVSTVCTDTYDISSIVIPMDGYHYSKDELRRLDPPEAIDYLPRRGAPHTFDAERFVTDLTAAKQTQHGAFPVYDRTVSDPIENGVQLTPNHRIVFIEGNYLLLGCGGMVPGYVTATEAARWSPLPALFDTTWFVTPTRGLPEQRQRLITRHLATWTAAKTLLFRATNAQDGATKRTESNDLLNVHVVNTCRSYADVIIEN